MSVKDSLRPKVASLSVGLILGSSIISPVVQAETVDSVNIPTKPEQVQKLDDIDNNSTGSKEKAPPTDTEAREARVKEEQDLKQKKQLEEVKEKEEQKAKAELEAKEKAETEAKAKEQEKTDEKEKAEQEAQKKADEAVLRQAKELEDKELKELLDIEGDFFDGGNALPNHLKKQTGSMTFSRFFAPARATVSYGVPNFSPYDVPNPSGWGAVQGDNDQFNPQGGNNLSYNIYTENAGNKKGLEVVQKRYPGKTGQRYLKFSGFALQKGYSNQYPHNQRTYIGVVSDDGTEKFYATDVQENTDATRDFTYGYGTKYQPRQCRDDEYNQWSDSGCTMNYKGVGFDAYIPLDDLFGDMNPNDAPRSWKVKVYHMVKGNGGAGNPHYVWNWVKLPLNKQDLGKYTSHNEATGMIDFTSGRGTNTAQVNTPDHIRRTAPASASGDCPIGSNCRYFKTGVNYPIIGVDQSRTVVWYKYGKYGNEPNDSWGQSQYFKLTGSPATITFRPNPEAKPVEDAKIKTKYVNKETGNLYEEFTEDAVRGKKYDRSEAYNKKGGNAESEFYPDVFELYKKKVYVKDSWSGGNGGTVFVNQEQKQSKVAKTDGVEEFTFTMDANRNPSATGGVWNRRLPELKTTYNSLNPLIFKDSTGVGFHKTGGGQPVRYYDTPVVVQYIDKEHDKLITETVTRVIPYGKVTISPAPTGVLGNCTRCEYMSLPENKDVVVTSGYTHPGNKSPETVYVKFYYKQSVSDPSGVNDTGGDISESKWAHFKWYLEKESNKDKSKLVVYSGLDSKTFGNFYAVRNARKLVDTADDKEYRVLIDEKTKKDFPFISDDKNGDGHSDAKNYSDKAESKEFDLTDIQKVTKKDYEPNELKGRKLHYVYEFEGTHSYYNRFVCTYYEDVYDNEGKPTGRRACGNWEFHERVPIWEEDRDKYGTDYWTAKGIRTVKFKVETTKDADHKYGEEIQFEKEDTGREIPQRYGDDVKFAKTHKEMLLVTGREGRYRYVKNREGLFEENSQHLTSTETFTASDNLLFKTEKDSDGVAKYLTQQGINIGGSLSYNQTATLSKKDENGGLGREISYDRDLVYIDKNGNRTSDKTKDVDGRANNGTSGFYVGDVDNNLREKLHVVKDEMSVEKDRKGNNANFYKLPVSAYKGRGSTEFSIRTSDDYLMLKNTGFQFSKPSLSSENDYGSGILRQEVIKLGRKEYEKVHGVKPTDEDLPVRARDVSSIYYMPIEENKDTTYGFKQMKPNEIQETELTVGSLGLNDITISIPYRFKYEKHLVGSTLERDDNGKDTVYVAEQNEGISKGVNYSKGHTVKSSQLGSINKEVNQVKDIKVNTFREGSSNPLRSVLDSFGLN